MSRRTASYVLVMTYYDMRPSHRRYSLFETVQPIDLTKPVTMTRATGRVYNTSRDAKRILGWPVRVYTGEEARELEWARDEEDKRREALYEVEDE